MSMQDNNRDGGRELGQEVRPSLGRLDEHPHTDPAVNRHLARTGVILALFFIGTVGGGFAWWRRSAASAAAASAAPTDRVVPVIVAPVLKKDYPIYLDGLGSAVPLHTVTVHTQVDGRLDAVGFKEGQLVHKGDLLAQVDPRPYVIQLHTAEAALARDTAQAREGRVNLGRYQTLRKENLVAQQQVDDQQALADQYDATVRSDQAAIESAKLNLDYAHITSPIDGVTGVRLIDPGNIVHAADTTGIVVLTQLDPMTVIFTLPEDDLPRISEKFAPNVVNPDGSPGSLEVEAFSRDGSKKLATGKLTLIDNEINQTTATIRLRATFDNPKTTLWPNEFVKARLLLTLQKDAIVIPAPAVQRGPQGTFVYVVGDDKTAAMRPIEVDSIQGDSAIIAKGLSAGEKVVTDGLNQLKPGSKVSERPPEKAAASGSPADSATPAGAPSGAPSGSGSPRGKGAGGAGP
jgi:multidrug efflux system membrane fusion protein